MSPFAHPACCAICAWRPAAAAARPWRWRFFALVATLVPLGVGADCKLLARVAGGVLWVAAVLAALLSLDRLFQGDFEDGSLDVIALSPLPLESVSLAKIAGPLALHRPAADLAVAAAGAAVQPAAGRRPWSCSSRC